MRQQKKTAEIITLLNIFIVHLSRLSVLIHEVKKDGIIYYKTFDQFSIYSLFFSVSTISKINSDKNGSSTLNIQKSQNPVLDLQQFSMLAYISYSRID